MRFDKEVKKKKHNGQHCTYTFRSTFPDYMYAFDEVSFYAVLFFARIKYDSFTRSELWGGFFGSPVEF